MKLPYKTMFRLRGRIEETVHFYSAQQSSVGVFNVFKCVGLLCPARSADPV